MYPGPLGFLLPREIAIEKLKMWDEARKLYKDLQSDYPEKAFKQMGLLECELQQFEPAIEQLKLARQF